MKTTYVLKLSTTMIILVLFASCKQKELPVYNLGETDLTQENLIPFPRSVEATNDGFALDPFTGIYTFSDEASEFEAIGLFLSKKIASKTGLTLPVNDREVERTDRIINIVQKDSISLSGDEAYELHIGRDTITLAATAPQGAFRGVQTLRQLIPEAGIDTLAEFPIWRIPTGRISDVPNFEYRGSMLDVARHFFSVEDVKKYLDLLAYYKINYLHLHLTDDQGWRIEIKSWPKLTEIGGSTEVGGEAGGYFTQEDYKDIVDYAARLYITIVPEVDMPGHTNAASASYAFLNGAEKPAKLYEGTRVGFSTFDTRKDTVYQFIDDVVREISDISPGPYFHIGGDESHVTKKDDYRYFVSRVEKIVQKYGKRMIGWDEVATADIDSTSIAQFWASLDNAKLAEQKGMQVILSPASKSYLDMKYDTLSEYGLAWAAYIPVDSAYIWTPETYSGIPRNQILGVEAPLWSETISNIEELEYLAFPRMIGYSELSWTDETNRDWEKFKVRLANQAAFLERMNVKYYPSPRIDWVKDDFPEKQKVKD
ncbi:family 20 glycosylhydrolase [Lentiprolixibacter aurantiacus]|uniref:beta-N-acetylhexosaminidase n=1 Tax=Lentiprolixibacter aurantiacus TaxID=2993939 RepID=A0AAE3SP48_9FLAO|nr:family 20 glycosylhydrolase [Lentiprolixibacter aurantiacus]MCX2720462.1 family 20 glycosylhydrolase [Lentiprolixibacter aurantiacus]